MDRRYETHPPCRPPPPREEQEESQDLYDQMFDDIDWDGDDIPQALREPGSSQGQDCLDEAQAVSKLKEAIDDERQWFVFRSFKECFSCDLIGRACDFMSTWVGCKLLGSQSVEEVSRFHWLSCMCSTFVPGNQCDAENSEDATGPRHEWDTATDCPHCQIRSCISSEIVATKGKHALLGIVVPSSLTVASISSGSSQSTKDEGSDIGLPDPMLLYATSKHTTA